MTLCHDFKVFTILHPTKAAKISSALSIHESHVQKTTRPLSKNSSHSQNSHGEVVVQLGESPHRSMAMVSIEILGI